MRRTEGIEFALAALGEAGQSAGLAKRANPLTPTGENFMWIGLMAYIPKQPIARRIENMVNGNRELDNAQSRAKMAASD